MKNYEKYADEIREYRGCEFCEAFIIPNILKSDNCAGMTCYKCRMLQMLWLLEDYEEPEVDWSKVEVDTPILVRDNEDDKWLKRHFAKYENGRVYVWTLERTSWTTLDDKCVMDWNYAKLAEDKKKPEVDWSKVEVDTIILVKSSEKGDWLKRHFAKYENGDVYAWDNGHTSNESSCMVYCKYAKLAESEGAE
mgnify:FL=1